MLMEIEEIQELVKKFQQELKPVTPEMKAMATGVAVEEAPPPAPEKELCVHQHFLDLVHILPAGYIGGDGESVKEVVESVLGSIAVCGGKSSEG